MIKKIFPLLQNKREDKITIIVISSAFRQRRDFWNISHQIQLELKSIVPFNLISDYNSKLEIWSVFLPYNYDLKIEEIQTPKISLKDKFESVIDTKNQKINLNENLLFDVIRNTNIVNKKGKVTAIKEIFSRNHFKSKDFLPVILFPFYEGVSGVVQVFNSNNDFDYIATTIDQNWIQVILKALCKKLGLRDEFEQDGDFYEKMNNIDFFDYRSPNLVSRNNLNIDSINEFKWNTLIPKYKENRSFKENFYVDHPHQPDLTIPNYNYTPEKIEFWEGGEGFRSNVFRFAKDCLMRREIGNAKLPLKDSKVPFCPVCEAYLKNRLYSL